MNLPSFEFACNLAATLVAIPRLGLDDAGEYVPYGFESHGEEQAEIESLTLFLDGLCRGERYGARNWTPEEQAVWIVNEICGEWHVWEGTEALARVFRNRFPIAAGRTIGP